MSDFVSAQYTIDEIKNVLNNQMNGLAAIKSAEETIDGRLTDNSTGLSALKLATTTVDDKLSNATYGLAAIKGLLNTTDGRLTNGTNGLSAIKGAVDASNNYLSNATYGLSAIKTAIDSKDDIGCKNYKMIKYGSLSNTSGAFSNIVNISGRGRLYVASFSQYTASDTTIRFRITIDGTVFLYLNAQGGGSMIASGVYNQSFLYGVPGAYWGGSTSTRLLSASTSEQIIYGSNYAMVITDYIPFNASLKIEYSKTYYSSSDDQYAVVIYSLA